jgi:hypothetical protein
MTMKNIADRLGRNAVAFMLAGEREKAEACMEVLSVVKAKDFISLRGKVVDNL